jgi:drug/metabolite transporter (DMT)-like permease
VGASIWADLGLLVVAAVWGGTFVMVKDALSEAGPLTFLAVRFALAAVVLVPTLARRREALSWRLVGGGGGLGLLLFGGYAFQTAGLQFTSASKAGFITGLSVVIVPLFSALVLQRPPGLTTWLGVSLATVGLALLSLGDELSVGLGDGLVLGCAFCFALHIVALGRLSPKTDTLALTSAQILAAACLNTAGALIFEAPRASHLIAVLPAALFTGLFATVGAFYLQTYAQRFTTPTHTALIFSMEPVFAALFAYLLAGERLEARGLIGCGLILAGMLSRRVKGAG